MDTDEQPKVRASRHVHWLTQALAPIQPQIDEARFERLIAALIASTGLEAFIALRDISVLDAAEAGKIMRWTAQALLKSTLAEIEY